MERYFVSRSQLQDEQRRHPATERFLDKINSSTRNLAFLIDGSLRASLLLRIQDSYSKFDGQFVGFHFLASVYRCCVSQSQGKQVAQIRYEI